METLTDALQRTTSERRKSSTSGSWPSLSVRQQKETDEFTRIFPSIDKVYSFFSPGRWGYVLEHTQECLNAPCIMLSQLDSLYGISNAAKNVLRSQLVGLYSVTTGREIFDTKSTDLASDLFLGKYGKVCSMYDSILYFALYPMEFKESYTQYDLTDILLQFGRKYQPWKRQRIKPDEQPEQTKGITLAEMVYKWVAEGRTDESFHEGGLFQTGIITDGMIQAARSEFAKAADGAAF